MQVAKVLHQHKCRIVFARLKIRNLDYLAHHLRPGLSGMHLISEPLPICSERCKARDIK